MRRAPRTPRRNLKEWDHATRRESERLGLYGGPALGSRERYWWRIAAPDGSYAYSAAGNHGQFIFVSPDDQLIVVRNGERYGIELFEWFAVFTGLADELRGA